MSTTEKDPKAYPRNSEPFYSNAYHRFSRFLSFLASSRIILSLSGMLLYALSSLLCGSPPNPLLLQSAFMVTFAVYTLNLVTDASEDKTNRGEPEKINKQLVMMSTLAISSAIFFSAFLGIKAVLVISAPFLAGIVYSVKIVPKIPRVKEIFAATSTIVAVSWGVTSALLPFIQETVQPDKMFIVFLYVFIQIFIGTVLSDVLDMTGDLKSGINTIPIKLGLPKTKTLLVLMNTVLIPMNLYVWAKHVFAQHYLILGFGIIYGYFMIFYFCNSKRPRIMYETVIDGMFIPQLLLVAVSSIV